MLRALPCLTAMLLAAATQGFAQKTVSDLHNFGTIELKAPMEHTFDFRNDRPEALEIKNVQLTPPLTVTRMTSRVEPGARGSVTIRLETPRERGDFKGFVAITFKNADAKQLYFWVVGRLEAPIDFEPFAAFFVSTQRGETKTKSLVITSHEAEPLTILEIKHDTSRFTTRLETLEPGRRYRLSLTVKADAPAGRATEYITLVTSSQKHPLLKVQANTAVHERVYTFPEAIGFKTIPVASLKAQPHLVQNLSQLLMVYQKGGKDFKISARSDVPFLRLTSEQADLKDRYGIKIEIVPERLTAGEIKGSIIIATNDPQFPQITVPVTATVQGSW
ncbi:MAG: DUF1573 domain-containing protein [Acidobacteriia bacterium]|nr:DUF1573 domain-containing protein [Terriglobia bacterium]